MHMLKANETGERKMLQKMKKIRSGLLALFIAAAMMIPTGTAFTQTAYAEDDYILIIGSKR